MNIEKDSLFLIGKTHQVCEDYALHGEVEGIPFIIVSDGCSGSNHTDIGSRILTHSAVKAIHVLKDNEINIYQRYERFGDVLLAAAEDAVFTLGLELQCLDATLIISFVLGNKLYVFMYGDGSILLEYKGGYREYTDISFVNNAPYYLSYQLDKERNRMFEGQSGSQGMTENYNGDKQSDKYNTQLVYSWDLEDINSIIISTDGASSFVHSSTTNQPLDLNLVMNELLSLKNTKGEFLNRRVRKFTSQWRKENIDHYDDLGVAGFVFTE